MIFFGDRKVFALTVSTKAAICNADLHLRVWVIDDWCRIVNYFNFANLRDAARNGSVAIAEGKVDQFVPMP